MATSNVTVNWRDLINDNKRAVSEFACGSLSYRKFASALTKDVRGHVYNMEKHLKVSDARTRARKALSRVR